MKHFVRTSLVLVMFLHYVNDKTGTKDTRASLVWTVDQKISRYGETIILLCHVPNCCPQYAGWNLFDGEGIRHTFFTDVKSHTNTAAAKYDGEVKTNGYTLTIRNLTKQDVNVSYACIYGPTIGDPLILLEKDVFEALHENVNRSKDTKLMTDNTCTILQEKIDILICINFIVVTLALLILLSEVAVAVCFKRRGYF